MRTICIALLLTASQDWPRFRGPNGAGVSEATGLPKPVRGIRESRLADSSSAGRLFTGRRRRACLRHGVRGREADRALPRRGFRALALARASWSLQSAAWNGDLADRGGRQRRARG